MKLALSLLTASLLATTTAHGAAPAWPPAAGKAADARVQIVEIGDYQCPFCQRAQGTLAQIEETYGKQVQHVFIHQPLSFHQQALPAALAAEAARRMGKFWPLHRALMKGGQAKALSAEDIAGYARQVGLNAKRFLALLGDPAVAAAVARDQRLATAIGARGTPTFFVNGHKLAGAQPFDKFAALIDAELDAAKAAGRKGGKWIAARTKEHNADLHSYVFAGVEPPATPPPAARKPVAVDTTVYKVTVRPDDPALGPADALATLVVFSDFQCPFCARLEPTLADLVKRYGGDLRVVFKHQPLPFHKQARPAANAAECARAQGKFWPMHDKLWTSQRDLSAERFEAFAEELGLRVGEFRECVAAAAHDARVAADMALAAEVGARGTPTSFVNGLKLVGARPSDDFVAAIDPAVAAAKRLVASGVSRPDVYAKTIAAGTVIRALDPKVQTIDTSVSPRLGPVDAKVEVVVFSEFQCPFCSRLAPTLQEVAKHYGQDVAIVFKHFPLDFHSNARSAAKASLCADDQGKFWPMHDAIFAHQQDLTTSGLQGRAAELGLDTTAFNACLASPAHEGAIDKDVAEGKRLGVRGTPTVFVGGRLFKPQGWRLDEFRKAFEELKAGAAGGR